LSGNNNTYSGGTIVNNGTLLVSNTSGSGTGTGAVTVGPLGTLGGTGTISGKVTFTLSGSDGGTLAPGNTPGTLTIDDDLVLNSASKLAYELSAANQSPGAPNNDYVVVTGDLTLAGDLRVTGSGDFSVLPAGTEWTLMTYGTLNNASAGLTFDPMNLPVLGAGLEYSIQAASQTVKLMIVATAIPEPGAVLFGVLVSSVIGLAVGGKRLKARLAARG
jgi:hypothetical protein